MAKLTQEEILAYLDEATILELNELVKAIEEKFNADIKLLEENRNKQSGGKICLMQIRLKMNV